VMAWLHQPDTQDRKQHMIHILPHIHFPHMKKQFLVDIIPYVANQFSDDTRLEIQRMYKTALEYHVGGRQRLTRLNSAQFPAQLDSRPVFPEPNKFTIKCQFLNVSKWELSARYYSAPVFSNGYEFYFFLRKQRISEIPPEDPNNDNNPADFTLAGYLRCTSKLLPPRHYLPICSTVHIPMKGIPSERRFTPSKVVFEASEKAIGGKLTLPNENWRQIVSGESPLVIDDTITVHVMVEFLDSDVECQLIDETTE